MTDEKLFRNGFNTQDNDQNNPETIDLTAEQIKELLPLIVRLSRTKEQLHNTENTLEHLTSLLWHKIHDWYPHTKDMNLTLDALSGVITNDPQPSMRQELLRFLDNDDD